MNWFRYPILEDNKIWKLTTQEKSSIRPPNSWISVSEYAETNQTNFIKHKGITIVGLFFTILATISTFFHCVQILVVKLRRVIVGARARQLMLIFHNLFVDPCPVPLSSYKELTFEKVTSILVFVQSFVSHAVEYLIGLSIGSSSTTSPCYEHNINP